MTTIHQQQLHLGAGQHRGALSVFPIWQQAQRFPVITLADELSVSVREKDSPEVPWLHVEAGDRPVLLLEGDVVVGGKQNRFAVKSTVLAAGTRAEIEVRCVEQERWHGQQDHVAGSRRASSYIRSDFDQGGVWNRVEQERERARASSPPRVDDLQMLPGQCGVLIGIGGRPRLVELFADQELLAQAWGRILQAAAGESAAAPQVRTTGHTAREFFRRVAALTPVVTDLAGIGRAVAVTRGSLQMRGITLNDQLLYASVLTLGSAA